MRMLLVNAGPIAHMASSVPIRGHITDESEYIHKAGLGILVNDYIIERIDQTEALLAEFSDAEIVDLEGRAVIPGLVDSHTHLLWAGDRSREITWKQSGLSYKEIADRGGGISATVMPTRESSNEALAKLGLNRMAKSLRNGTTHLEVKSGYGLDTQSELRLLSVAESIAKVEGMPSLDLTWLGAHAAPPELSLDAYVEVLLSEQLPKITEQGYARSADVFCEPGWFSVEQSEEILKQSRKNGLDLRMHIDEFTDGGGGDLASELKVQTADHAHYSNDNARHAMNDSGVNTAFLPGTPYTMGDKFPPFDYCLENEILWSIASDFNPNCQTLSLPFIGSILVQRNDISPISALAACTVNSAATTPHPSGLAHGSIVEGSIANLNVLDSPWVESWCLKPGHSPFEATILEGQMIYH